jgi:hypothetical protein
MMGGIRGAVKAGNGKEAALPLAGHQLVILIGHGKAKRVRS